MCPLLRTSDILVGKIKVSDWQYNSDFFIWKTLPETDVQVYLQYSWSFRFNIPGISPSKEGNLVANQAGCVQYNTSGWMKLVGCFTTTDMMQFIFTLRFVWQWFFFHFSYSKTDFTIMYSLEKAQSFVFLCIPSYEKFKYIWVLVISLILYCLPQTI